MTVLLITHYMDEAAQADRVLVMDDGAVVMDDIPQRVFSRVTELQAIGLDVPQPSELAFQLRRQGVELPYDILTVDDCVTALAHLLEA